MSFDPDNLTHEERVEADASTQIELLKAVLAELKLHTIYLHQLPLVLNAGTNFEDDPEKLREELLDEI